MSVNYILCAGLLTFDIGPASYVGNQYLSAWSGFYISLAVFVSASNEIFSVRVRDGVAVSLAVAAENSDTAVPSAIVAKTSGEFISWVSG